ncbi:MAG: SDR family oxidoreductase [Gammaproteobacteria bacterium]|uniref:SDR family NAD(P)-dependent oxidoreductase n=1 Tax=Pseudomaricurvus alcaniphilus TaxID=1166482 RepID=UPI00140DEA78|nr:SDR family oxidoreductase [Pseudomaricurvus alcaniphilus]MBR9910636.1 SDR family oxidoreductase [Gammaproteobacteria bacterium]NHN36840.1 SDR family oxidoreductase [Pseudomaricurvus alcaniphilus]
MNDKRALYPEGAALVVGGSGGVGRSICEELAANGVKVVLTYNSNSVRAEALATDISAKGGVAEIAQLSLDNLERIQALAEHIVHNHGRLHSVFIATGFDIPQIKICDVTPKQWRTVLRSDAEGVFNLVYATLPHLRAGGGGSYVHISSAALQRFAELDILSVAPKAAIEELMKGVAKEEGEFGIRANSIAIGVIETGIFLRLKEEGVFDEKWQEMVRAMLPLNRFGQPQEVADMAVFLGSNRAAYTTGQLIPVDGGFGV